MTFTGKAINGTFLPDSPSMLEKYLMEQEGKKITVDIKRIFNRRSNPQNRYLFGLVYPMMAERLTEMTGLLVSVEDVHREMMEKFNAKQVMVGDTFMKVVPSSADLTTVQFNNYKEKLQQFSALYLSINIPDPNELINDQDGLKEIME